MSKKEEFIKYISTLIEKSDIEMNENVKIYWEALKGKKEEDKPLFTDNGKIILKFLQDNKDTVDMWKAKDIAEEISVSSRTVSGAMRKLVTDGFVEKVGQDPVIYSITEKGREIQID